MTSDLFGEAERKEATATKGEDGKLGVVSCSPVKHQQQGEMASSSFV